MSRAAALSSGQTRDIARLADLGSDLNI